MVKDEKKLKEEIKGLTEKWKRALADYQNLEKRVNFEKEDFVRFANAQLILKILPALDSLEKAEKHLKEEGLSLAIRQLRQVLQDEGLEEIEVLGREFDPEEMECVAVGEGEIGLVLAEERKGYKLKGKVLRCAQVKVGQKLEEKENE